jgi:peptidoglycan biosynthesis protein MviN/MurJ (putative lipid II flippase)
MGMLGLSLIGQPLSQLVQAKLCAAHENDQLAVFKQWLWAVAAAVLALAAVLFIGREPIVSLVYLRGKFSAVELSRVVQIMPAWIGYFVVASLNAIVARYLFGKGSGGIYVRRQLWAYALANVTRAACWTRLEPSMIVWCSVVAEGTALLMNLRSCFQTTAITSLQPQMVGAQEI